MLGRDHLRRGCFKDPKGQIPAIYCPRGGSSPVTSHGPIQTAVEQDEYQEHLIYITVWSNTVDVFEKVKEIVQILLEADFAMKQKKAVRKQGHTVQRDIPIPDGNMPSNKSGGAGRRWQLTAWGRAGHRSPVGAIAFCTTWFGYSLAIIITFPSFSVLVTLFS